MSITKVCAIGNLDIEFNLVLRISEADCFKFEISDIHSPSDLKNIFYPVIENENNDNEETKKINYFDYVSLSSNNDFINSLLFINRAFKNKTFVELIMLNQLNFSNETSFIRDLIKQICAKNYFFIVENKIYDIPSKIKFNIKILEDDTDEILSEKSFDLFENNAKKENDEINNSHLNLFHRISYNFSSTQFFLTNFSDIINYKEKGYSEISLFYKYLIKSVPSMKIITIFKENSLESSTDEFIDIYKEIIEYSDYIFSEKKSLNEFYKKYNELYDIDYYEDDSLNENNDLILKDTNKKRKGIERTSILMEKLDYFHIYIQKGVKMELTYNEDFEGKTIWKSHSESRENKIKKCLNSKIDIFKGIFIGSFLSRLIYGKTIKTCVTAGCLSVKNMIEIINNNIDYVTDIDLYNVTVPIKKLNKYEKIQKQILNNNKKIRRREKGFVLDCINENLSKKKDYNPLKDIYCQGFFYNQYNFKHLIKLGFINKKGKVLKDPDSIPKKSKKDNLQKNILTNPLYIALRDTNKFNNTLFSKTRNKWIDSTKKSDMGKTYYTAFKSSSNDKFSKKSVINLPMMKTYHFKNKSNNFKYIDNQNDGSISDRRLISRNQDNNLNHIGTNYVDKKYFRQILKKYEKKIK